MADGGISTKTRGAVLGGFQRLALMTTGATYLLILVGSLVRVSGAGLGCPDWPKCFGSWVPPTSAADLPATFDRSLFNLAHTWTEYLNRLLGVAVGFLIFATLVSALMRHRQQPRILWPTVAAFLLVGFEGWLGGEVVRLDLKSWVVTAHLVLALVIVSLLLYATVSAFFAEGPLPKVSASRRVLGAISNATIGLVLVQIALGALVRGSVDETRARFSDLPRGSWLEQVGALDLGHRQLAVLCFLACGLLMWRAWSRHADSVWIVRAALLSLGLAALQVALGLGLAYLGMPGAMQVLHLVVASLLLGSLTALALLAYRLPEPQPVEA